MPKQNFVRSTFDKLNNQSFLSRLVNGFLLIGVFFLLIMGLAAVWIYLTQRQSNFVASYLKNSTYHIHTLNEAYQDILLKIQHQVTGDLKPKSSEGKVLAIKLKKIFDNEITPRLKMLDELQYTYGKRLNQEITGELKGVVDKFGVSLEKACLMLKNQKAFLFENTQSSASAKSSIYFDAALNKILQNELLPLKSEKDKLTNELTDQLQVAEAITNNQLRQLQSLVWFLAFAFLLTIVIVSTFFIRNIYSKLLSEIQLFRHYFEELLKGMIPQRVRSKTREFARIENGANTVSTQLKELQTFAENISKFHFHSNLTIFDKEGDLGMALNRMQEGLGKLSLENETRFWINNGVARFVEILTRHVDDLNQLAEEVIYNLVDYLHINQGGFFIIESYDGQEYFHLKASYAYERKKFLDKKIPVSQGLLGQAVKEEQPIFLKEIPSNYIEITSGLGGQVPDALYIVPLKSDHKVMGVIEMACFGEMESHKRELMDKISGNLGDAIAKTKYNEQTRKLLNASQEMTRILQSQESQLRKNMNELQQTQALMSETQKNLAEKEANLEALINNTTTHAIISFDKNYRITVLNQTMRQLYLETEIFLEVGKNLKEKLPKSEFERYLAEYERVLAGEKFVSLQESERYGKKSYYESHYNPIKDGQGQVIGASVFIENISQRRQAEIRMKQTESSLISLINDTEDMIMALDKNYRIIILNEVTRNYYLEKGLEIKLGDSIFKYLPEQSKDNWMSFYDKALKGERFVKVMEEGESPSQIFREYWFNPIKEDQVSISGVSIFSRDITAARRAEMQIKTLLLESLDTAEQMRIKEEELNQKIKEYESRIKELEEKINV